MNKLTRRTFGKRILAAGVLPLFPQESQQQAEPIVSPLVSQTIAGYKPSAEERSLAEKFLSTHEKNISLLRRRDLPNSLAPYFMVSSPTMDGEPGDHSK